MTLDEAIARYIAIPEDRKAWFLLRLSWWLTVSLRGCYDEANAELLATKLKGARTRFNIILLLRLPTIWLGSLIGILMMFSFGSAPKKL